MIEWLQDLLKDNYIGYEDEDLIFAVKLQEIIFKILLDYFQEDLEKKLDFSLFYASEFKKRLYHTISLEYSTKEITINSLPQKLLSGVSYIKGYADTRRIDITVDLPYIIPEDSDIISISGASFDIDDNRIIGEGQVNIIYNTSAITPEVENGYIVGPSNLKKAIVTRTPYDPVAYKGQGKILADGSLFDPAARFDKLPINTVFVIGATEFELKEIKDFHTAVFYTPVFNPGSTMPYTHYGFGFVTTTEMQYIPEFDNGLRDKIDYIISDGKIGFAKQQDDLLIAPMSYKENDEIYKKFGAYINAKDAKTMWYGLFGGDSAEALAFTLSGLLKLPVTMPHIGSLEVIDVQVDNEEVKEYVEFTVKRNNRLECSENYFEQGDRYIKLSNSKYIRIHKIISPHTVIYDNPGLETGSRYFGNVVKINSNTTVTYKSEYGGLFEQKMPGISFYGIGEKVSLWKRLCSGVRVFDQKTDINSFNLENNIFHVYFDFSHPNFDAIIKKLKPTHDYFTSTDEGEGIGISDFIIPNAGAGGGLGGGTGGGLGGGTGGGLG